MKLPDSRSAKTIKDLYIVGIDMLRLGRFPDKTPGQLGAQVALGAMDAVRQGQRQESLAFDHHDRGKGGRR